jgi:Fic family protein
MATMVDAIEAEVKIKESKTSDVDDILHYIKALNYGVKRVTEENFPMSLRFVRELHQELMQQARATHFSNPGEFRKSQNWIGGTRPDNASFVPPPVREMEDALREFEKFIHADDMVPVVIKAGLLHAQFETIHPFLDGNGRKGRMLITFYLWKEKYLENPVLFLSAYLKKHQQIYYEKLSGYHEGRIAEWVEFFLDGVIEIANEAIRVADQITALREKDMAKLQRLGKRAAESAVMVLPKLFGQPIVNTSLVRKWTGFTRAGAQRVIERFIDIGILSKKDEDRKYGQSYMYKKYLDIFISGGETKS